MTPPITPSFPLLTPPPADPPAVLSLIQTLSLAPHPEGGFFSETDRDPLLIPSPFPLAAASDTDFGPGQASPQRPGFDPARRNASTSIYYLLAPSSPQGNFHRNRGRTVHTLHRGRGRYVVLHEDGQRETFVVGQAVEKGERLQWIVEGGKYKASFLLPDHDDLGSGGESGGLLISETVVPGFEFADHDFLTGKGLKGLVGEERAEGLKWLVRE